MFIALSQFTIANGMSQQVREAFKARPHLVDSAPGFLGMEVMSPVDQPQDIWLLTRWSDEPSFREWHRGHDYHVAHKGIPKGLKLTADRTQLHLFDVFAT
jgi:heme-degrading monooxygenase HmoA